ncbi:High frequency lysogenization protein HflD [Buchnera aphidicola (Thelaxes suberi)]|uniref:DUF489 family protein n=1 Tax=Buchnera aphidicola TaxID=9 RepID=UPI0034640209
MNKKFYFMALPLAGIVQSVYLIQLLANTGVFHEIYFYSSMYSISVLKPKSILSIYGNKEKNIKLGLEILLCILKLNYKYNDLFILLKYIFKLICLEKKLSFDKISKKIVQKKIKSVLYFKNKNKNLLIKKYAKIYSEIVSPLDSKMIIQGKEIYLKNAAIQEKINVLILAGLRSCALWRQIDGNQLKIIFFKKYIIKEIEILLSDLRKF